MQGIFIASVHISFVENIGNVCEMISITSSLDIIMLYNRALGIIRVLKAVVRLQGILVEPILRESEVLLEHNEEGKLQNIIPVVDGKGRLFFSYIKLVF